MTTAFSFSLQIIVQAAQPAGASGTKLSHSANFLWPRGIIKPGENSTVASQVDLGPTLFGMLKWQYHSKFFGKDILASGFTPRAFIGLSAARLY